MDYDELSTLTKTHPVFSALRKEWLPFAMAFLHRAFKRNHTVLLPQDVFHEQLDLYLEYVNSTLDDDNQYAQDANAFIDRWSREDLIRIRLHENGYRVQLSPHGERLLSWFGELQNQGLLATESRLRTIIDLLDETVTQSSEDVSVRLDQLYSRRAEIDAEIKRIEETGSVDQLSDVQIRERVAQVSDMATQLMRDFSVVEERFRAMAQSIQQEQLDPNAKRGEILGRAIDADEQLQESDEGQSFRAFYALLTHPQQRTQFESLIDALFTQPRLLDAVGENGLLRRLTSHLLDAGGHVNRSNQRLAEHLRRIVDTRNVTESRRVQTLAREIKYLVSQGDALAATSRKTFHDIEGTPEVELALERPLFETTDAPLRVIRPKSAESEPFDMDVLVALYSTFYIDETLLRENIARLLMSRSQVTLPELIRSYPIEKGMSEVIAYLLIAADAPHQIDKTGRDTLLLEDSRHVVLPHIVFRREKDD